MSRKKDNIRILSDESHKAYFERVYRQHFDRLYSYARIICNSPDLAKDVVSDFFYNLWKNQADLAGIENLKAYLFASIKNQSLQALAAQARELNEESLEVRRLSVEYINPEEVLLEKELREELDKIIAGLPDQCQLIFRMAREQGMKYNEIANELGISPETVKSQLKKAQARLRANIADFYLDKQEVTPDLRLTAYFLLLAGLTYCDIFN